jgi:23S rRNA-/tRNA-specific pseudouridylate synthase
MLCNVGFKILLISISITQFFFIYFFGQFLHIIQCVDGTGTTSQIKKHFKDIGVPADIKYIDPTYMVRACRANASDAILCTVLGQNAVS